MTPQQYDEARRLHSAGLRLVELYPNSKRPVGDDWNHRPVTRVNPDAGGYGLLLAANNLCSVDVDNEPFCREGLLRCGFDLDMLRDTGVATASTRPGSGGRITFTVPDGSPLRWVKFTSRDPAKGTILELRAAAPNLQDSLPGTVYLSQDGSGPWEQQYDGPFTMDFADVPPPALLDWWERLSTDVEFLRGQQQLFVGDDAQLAVSSGDGQLAYSSPWRMEFNAANSVVDILERHNYSLHKNGRYAPPTASGAAAVRPIPGRDDLWQSDHASDPLHGTFDAWVAHVTLDHGGDVAAGEARLSTERALVATDGFEELPAVKKTEDSGGEPEPLPNFDREKTGRIKATVLNLVAAIRRPDIIGGQVGHDTFRDEIMLCSGVDGQWRPFGDADYVWLRARLETGTGGFSPISKEIIRDVVLAVAKEAEFDSAKLWINGLGWDGVPRCETFLGDHFGVEDTPYTRAVSRYMWTAMAGRVLEPGCKADMVPILVGAQGLGKSSAIGALVPSPDFFTEVSFAEKDDDLSRKMRGKLVAEIGELRGLHTKELEAIKAFITRTHEQWIPKYREFSNIFARRLIFIGTTNKDQFLADETGNRRWLPVRVARVAVDEVRAVAAQCWAEAKSMFLTGGVQWQDAERLSQAEHEEYSFRDSWEAPIKRWLEDQTVTFFDSSEPFFVTTSAALTQALGIEQKNLNRRDEMRAGTVFRNLGLIRKKVRIDGVPNWVYVPENG